MNELNQLERNVISVGASTSGVIKAGAKGVFFRCISGSATINPNGAGSVALSAAGQSIYNFGYTPREMSHGEIAYTTGSASSLEITEDR
jgi:hypothetical protein